MALFVIYTHTHTHTHAYNVFFYCHDGIDERYYNLKMRCEVKRLHVLPNIIMKQEILYIATVIVAMVVTVRLSGGDFNCDFNED